jgi:hypothetical protein
MQAGVEGEWVGIKKDFEEEELRRKQQDDLRKKGKNTGKEKEAGESREGSDDGLEGECESEDEEA